MKKILCLFLSVMMLLSLSVCLAGCGPEDVRGDVVENNATQNPTENKTPTDTQTPTQNETEPDFSMGKATGSAYKNDFLGISWTLPEGWVFYSDEQIQQLNNVVGDYVDEEVAEKLKELPIIYDMYAQHTTDGSSVNINMEKLNALQIATLNIKQTLEAQIPTIKDTYANIGYTDTKVEYQKVTVDGKEFDGLKLTAKIQGIDFTMVIFTFRKSNYLANVSVGSLQAETLEEILGNFTVK